MEAPEGYLVLVVPEKMTRCFIGRFLVIRRVATGIQFQGDTIVAFA